jgi:DNA helicase-2/ATP-dependent DNA helicase PcrA
LKSEQDLWELGGSIEVYLVTPCWLNYLTYAELPDLFRQALNNYNDLLGLNYDMLIVDEYQDLNACDLEVVKRLADRGISIFAIGDDDQSIYSFRKAHPIGIQNFIKEFNIEKSCDYNLTICQRSPRLIFNWAQHVILGLPDRDRNRPKISFSEKAIDGTCALLRFNNENDESAAVTDIITWLHRNKGISPSEILVLYRTDTIGDPVAVRIRALLSERGIPTANPKLIQEVLSTPENRRLLSILHLKINPTDSLAWWSLIANTHGVGNHFVDIIYDLAVRSNTSFGQSFVSEADRDFPNCPPALRRRAKSLVQEINRYTRNFELPEESPENWGVWISSEVQNGKLPTCSPEFVELLIEISSSDRESLDFDRFLSQIEPRGKDLHQSRSGGVRFMSMMGSKGLTVKATIVVGVDNDIVPLPIGDQGEECRLLYVAMTRSTEYLFMTWVIRRASQSSYAGRENFGRRQYSNFLRGGPIESQDGPKYIISLLNS